MAIPVLIIGESGTGKTASLMNLDPDRVALIQTIDKRLPFKSKDWSDPLVTDEWEKMCAAINIAPRRGKDIVVLDDFQYLMANEFMHRSSEKSFDKFTEIAHHAWSVIKSATEAEGDHRVYFLAHTATSDGITRMKTIGKMLDEKITIEGLFTIVLKTVRTDQGFFFCTQNDGFDTCKSPIGLFDESRIANDLSVVDAAIMDYYNIPPLEVKKDAST